MTTFDPEFALEVMKRRQSEKNREAGSVHLEKFNLMMDGEMPLFGRVAEAFDKRIHALWAEADSYNSVIEYLEERIWDAKTYPEKVWATMEEWGWAPTGPEMVEDVMRAQQDIALGRRA